MFAVVGHNNLINEFRLQQGTFLLSILVIMFLVETVNEDEHRLATHYFLGGVHSQKVSFLKMNEVCLESRVNVKVIQFIPGLLPGVEIFSTASYFSIS